MEISKPWKRKCHALFLYMSLESSECPENKGPNFLLNWIALNFLWTLYLQCFKSICPHNYITCDGLLLPPPSFFFWCFVPMYLSELCAHRVWRGHQTWIIETCKLPHRCWKSNLGPLKEWQVFFLFNNLVILMQPIFFSQLKYPFSIEVLSQHWDWRCLENCSHDFSPEYPHVSQTLYSVSLWYSWAARGHRLVESMPPL